MPPSSVTPEQDTHGNLRAALSSLVEVEQALSPLAGLFSGVAGQCRDYIELSLRTLGLCGTSMNWMWVHQPIKAGFQAELFFQFPHRFLRWKET